MVSSYNSVLFVFLEMHMMKPFLIEIYTKVVDHSENHLQLVCWFLLLLAPLTFSFHIKEASSLSRLHRGF